MATYTIQGLQARGMEPLMRRLVVAAGKEHKLTYGSLAAELGPELGIDKIFPIHLGALAGGLMDRLIKLDPKLPLINGLVVGLNGLPGKGITDYLVDRFGRKYKNYEKMSKEARQQIASQAMRQVFAFPKWPAIYQKVFGKKFVPLSTPKLRERDGKSPDGTHGGGGESQEHRLLKGFVLNNPAAIGLKLVKPIKKVEWLLPSGDEVDVYFRDRLGTTLVEVKSIKSGPADFERGIYQCVKYRAVTRAQLDNPAIEETVRAILVTEAELPADLSAHLKRLDIEHKVVSVSRK